MNLINNTVVPDFISQQRDFWEDGLQNALPTGSEQRQEDGLLVPNFDGMRVMRKWWAINWTAHFGDYHLTNNPSYAVSYAGQLQADQAKIEF